MIKKLFSDKEVVIFDMEVIDFELEPNILIQFSARKYRENELIDKLNILIKHKEIELPDDFILRTRITKKLIQKQGISLLKAKTKILNFIDKDVTLVTYKGNYFYFPLLWTIFNNKLRNKTLDIIDIITAMKLVDNPDDISLEDLAVMLNIEFDTNKWHNSSYDVTIIEKIWYKLKAKSIKENDYE